MLHVESETKIKTSADAVYLHQEERWKKKKHKVLFNVRNIASERIPSRHLLAFHDLETTSGFATDTSLIVSVVVDMVAIPARTAFNVL